LTDPPKELVYEIWHDNLIKWDFVHDHFGFECDSCGLVPENIYCSWFYDKEKKRHYLRFLCVSCFNKNLKIGAHIKNYIELLGVQALCSFPKLNEYSDILFIAKNFIMRENNDIIKNNN
jgi:hypothetical protein